MVPRFFLIRTINLSVNALTESVLAYYLFRTFHLAMNFFWNRLRGSRFSFRRTFPINIVQVILKLYYYGVYGLSIAILPWYTFCVMQQGTIDEIATKVVPILKSAGVLRSSLFGSYVRGEQTAESDIDILIEFPQGKSLMDLVGLERELAEVLGKKVDLLTYNSISPYLKKYIQKDQVQIL